MKAILTYILTYCLFLFEQYEFHFSDSLYSASFGGNAYVTIESPRLKMRFVFDRGQLLLEFSSNKQNNSSWFSVDLLSQLFTDTIEDSALLDERYAHFLVQRMEEINNAFSDENTAETVKKLKILASKRAKRLFGNPKRDVSSFEVAKQVGSE